MVLPIVSFCISICYTLVSWSTAIRKYIQADLKKHLSDYFESSDLSSQQSFPSVDQRMVPDNVIYINVKLLVKYGEKKMLNRYVRDVAVINKNQKVNT